VAPVGEAVEVARARARRESGAVHAWLAGVASVLPAASTARAASVCAPEASGPGAYELEHEANAPPSRLHSNATPASPEASANVGEALLGSDGVELKFVSGAVLSIVTGIAAVSVVFPTLSVARATTWYVPSAGCPDHVADHGELATDAIETRFGAKVQSARGRQ